MFTHLYCIVCDFVLDTLNDDTYFVTVTKPIVSNRWKTMYEQKFDMSWGKATVSFEKK
jgi:hypothetical protein